MPHSGPPAEELEYCLTDAFPAPDDEFGILILEAGQGAEMLQEEQAIQRATTVREFLSMLPEWVVDAAREDICQSADEDSGEPFDLDQGFDGNDPPGELSDGYRYTGWPLENMYAALPSDIADRYRHREDESPMSGIQISIPAHDKDLLSRELADLGYEMVESPALAAYVGFVYGGRILGHDAPRPLDEG